MPINNEPHKGQTAIGSAYTVMNRVKFDGADVKKADITAIASDVRDKQDPDGSSLAALAVVVNDSIFDTLQPNSSDGRWEIDTDGHNFRFVVPASVFTIVTTYRVVFTFTPASGEAFVLIWEIKCIDERGNRT